MSSFGNITIGPLSPTMPTLSIDSVTGLYGSLISTAQDQSRYIRLYNKHRPTVEENLARVTDDPSAMFDDIISRFQAFDGGGLGGGHATQPVVARSGAPGTFDGPASSRF